MFQKDFKTDYNLLCVEFVYEVLVRANLIKAKDIKKYFDGKNIKFPTEFNVKMRWAELACVKEYIDKNCGLKDLHYWLQDIILEAQKNKK